MHALYSNNNMQVIQVVLLEALPCKCMHCSSVFTWKWWELYTCSVCVVGKLLAKFIESPTSLYHHTPKTTQSFNIP